MRRRSIRRLLVQLLMLCRYRAASARFLVFDIKRDYVDLPQRFPKVIGFRIPGPGFRWNSLEPPIKDVESGRAYYRRVLLIRPGSTGG